MLCILTFMWICGFRGDTNKKNVFFSTEFFITTISDFLSHTKRGCWVLEIHAKNLHWNSVNKIHRQHRTIFSPSYSWLISHLCNWGTRNIHPWCALNSHSHRWKVFQHFSEPYSFPSPKGSSCFFLVLFTWFLRVSFGYLVTLGFSSYLVNDSLNILLPSYRLC